MLLQRNLDLVSGHVQSRRSLAPNKRVQAGFTRARKHISSAYTRLQAATLMFELDSVAVDLQMEGHRVAFNKAYYDLGFDCANWNPFVYNDLLSQSDGRAETLVYKYFDTIGWPLSVTEKERGIFVGKIISLKEEALKKMLIKHEVPLRSGFVEVVQAAVDSGAVVAGIAGTLSSPEHDVASNVLALLGPTLAPHVKIFSTGINQGPSDDDTPESQPPASLDDQIRQATAASKLADAERFLTSISEASTAKPGMASVVMDPNLSAGVQRLGPQWFLAVSATLGVSISDTVVLVGTATTSKAAAAAGAVTVAIPRSMAKSAVFPGATAKFDDMGMGGATWARLSTLLAAGKQ